MASFPFFRFPYHNYYYPYYTNYNKITDQNKNNEYEINNSDIKKNKDLAIEVKKKSSKYNNFGPIRFVNPFIEDNNLNEPILEILGIQLYLDDIIILSLLFFLYKEEVQDEMLFLSLILLLLT